MKLDEIMHRLPEAERGRYAFLKSHMSSQQAFTSVVGLLSDIERAVLERIVKRQGLQSFEMHHLEKMADAHLSGAELKIGLLGLRRQGLIAAVRKTWGDRLYFIPADVYPWILQSCSPMPLQAYIGEGSEGSSVILTHEAKRGLEFELFYMLAWIAKNGLPVTAKGTIHKKSVQKLTALLEIQASDLLSLNLQFPHADLYTSPFVLVLDVAVRLRLLMKDPERMVLNYERLQEWLSQSRDQMQRSLWELWLEYDVQGEVWRQQLANGIAYAHAEKSVWYRVKDVAQWLNSFFSDRRQSLPMEVSEVITSDDVVRQLIPLCAFGWMELGTSHNGESCFRWTAEWLGSKQESAVSLQQNHGFLYIQPDFEIIVPPEFSFLDRWELECCAEHLRTDRVAIYRLTKESFIRAVDAGRSAEHVIDFLMERSRTEMPEHVRIAIEQWKQQYGRVYFAEAVLLRCEDEQMARRVRALTPLLAMIQPIGETDFIVPRELIGEIRSMLDKAGLTPRRQIFGDPASEQAAFLMIPMEERSDTQKKLEWTNITSQGIIYSGRTVQYYEIEPIIPRAEELFPDFHQVPPMWFKQLRAYHLSSCKEILERAIDWQTQVLTRLNGVQQRFTPLQVVKLGQEWTVKGYFPESTDSGLQEVELRPELEIKLLLPVWNEK